MKPDRTELIDKTIYRIEDCFACKFISKDVTDDEMVINFKLAHGLEDVELVFILFNKGDTSCGFDVVVSLDTHEEIVHTVQWNDFNPDEDNEDIVLATIQSHIFSFVDNWIKGDSNFVNLMSWAKSTGYNSTLLKKIKEITEKIL